MHSLKSITSNIHAVTFFLVIGCGGPSDPTRNPGNLQAIVGGKAPQKEVLASTVLLVNEDSICSGALIGPSTVLTAAHCFLRGDGAPREVLFGVSSSDVRARCQVSKFIRHAGYQSSGAGIAGVGVGRDDIALAHIECPQGLAASTKPVALASADHPTSDDLLILAGYGNTEGAQGGPQGRLRQTYGRLHSLRASGREFLVRASGDSGPCRGDSGGPAFVRIGGELVLAGITSGAIAAGQPCGNARYVYTNPSRYLTWIDENSKR